MSDGIEYISRAEVVRRMEKLSRTWLGVGAAEALRTLDTDGGALYRTAVGLDLYIYRQMLGGRDVFAAGWRAYGRSLEGRGER